jgi:hypothetical protein
MDAQGVTGAIQSEPQIESEPKLPQAVRDACDVAFTGAEPPDVPRKVRAAHKDYNSRGRCREHWYRMVWRAGEWRYLGDRRLAAGTFLASDRHDTVWDEVWPGEIVIQHDRGGPIDVAYLVVDQEKPLVQCGIGRTRDGQLRVTLPDGRSLLRPNPRRT